jgi:hypothetical protein
MPATLSSFFAELFLQRKLRTGIGLAKAALSMRVSGLPPAE